MRTLMSLILFAAAGWAPPASAALVGSGGKGHPNFNLTNCFNVADSVTTTAGGAVYFITPDGVARQLIPVEPEIFGGPALQGLPLSPPDHVDLRQQGYITPAKDQGGYGFCQTFATVAGIEAQYLIQWGASLNLSEEYLLNLANSTSSLTLEGFGGQIKDKLQLSKDEGMPLAADFANTLTKQSILDQLLPAMFFVDQDLAGRTDYDSVIQNDDWTRDLINFNVLIAPPVESSEKALYGPDHWTNIPADYYDDLSAHRQGRVLPQTLEKVLAAGHPIIVALDLGYVSACGLNGLQGGLWNLTKTPNPGSGHVILLTGYDRTNAVFFFKNSWGQQFGDNGFGEMSYDLVHEINEARFVDSVRQPGTLAPGGNAVWRGFWKGRLNGKDGVAVIYQSFVPSGGDAGGVLFANAIGRFVDTDGNTTFLPNVSNATVTELDVVDSENNPLFKLTRNLGSFTAQLVDSNGSQETWSRCNDAPFTYNVDPAPLQTSGGGQFLIDDTNGYLNSRNDPYVFPPCNSLSNPVAGAGAASGRGGVVKLGGMGKVGGLTFGPTHQRFWWRSDPHMSCSTGTLITNMRYENGFTFTLRDACVTTSNALPSQQCTSLGDGYVIDALATMNSPVNGRTPVDACSQRTDNGGTVLFAPNCPPAQLIFGQASPSNQFLSAGGGLNVIVQTGQDQCIGEADAPAVGCLRDYVLYSNGDCLEPWVAGSPAQ